MTEYEIADLAMSRQLEIQGLGDNLMTMIGLVADAITQYMSVLFAYIGVAYFVGAKLSRVQLWIFTVLYVFWQLLTVSAIGFRAVSGALMAGRLEELLEEAPRQFDASGASAWLGSSFVTLLLLALMASLYFMWSVRHLKTE